MAATIPGYMPMPAGFPYRDIFLRGKPQHRKYDTFWRKHPPMNESRWAKIFAPFDALDGFNELIESKTIQSETERQPSES